MLPVYLSHIETESWRCVTASPAVLSEFSAKGFYFLTGKTSCLHNLAGWHTHLEKILRYGTCFSFGPILLSSSQVRLQIRLELPAAAEDGSFPLILTNAH